MNSRGSTYDKTRSRTNSKDLSLFIHHLRLINPEESTHSSTAKKWDCDLFYSNLSSVFEISNLPQAVTQITQKLRFELLAINSSNPEGGRLVSSKEMGL